MRNKNMRSINYNDKFACYSSTDCQDFNNMRAYLNKLGYKILKIVLTDDGKFKFIGILKNKPLVKCLLKEKKLPERDEVYPSHDTYPKRCRFYENGICLCTDHSYCLYQATYKNIEELKFMANKYANYKYKKDKDKCSMYYEDTELGRIFSAEFRHLNYREEEE